MSFKKYFFIFFFLTISLFLKWQTQEHGKSEFFILCSRVSAFINPNSLALKGQIEIHTIMQEVYKFHTFLESC